MPRSLRHLLESLVLPCLLVVGGLAATAQQQQHPPPPQQRPPAPPAAAGKAPPAASLEKMADEVLPDVEKLRGWSFARPVRRERVGPEGVRLYLQRQIGLALPPGRKAIAEAFLQAVGLIPPGTDLVGSALKVLDQQVAGYYDPAAGTLYLVDREVPMPEFMQRVVLAHELTHALDDQQVGIGRMVEASATRTEDEDLVLSSLGEGSATSLMFHYLARQMAAGKVNAMELAAYFSREVEQAKALAGMPRYFNALFGSYVVGATFLAQGDMQSLLRQADDRDVGERFRTAWATPPRSSEQLLHPEKYWDPSQRDEPVVFDDPTFEGWLAKKGRHAVHRNTLGELLTAVLTEPRGTQKDLAQMMGGGWTNPAATGWGGDRFYLLADGETADAAARDLRNVKGVWVTAWDSERDRDEFIRALAAGQPAPGASMVASGARLAIMFVNFEEAERAALVTQLAASPPKMSRAGQPWVANGVGRN